MNEGDKKTVEEINKKVADKQGVEVETIQLLTFSLDNEDYAVPITDLKEIIKTSEITPVPNSPDFVRGILNLRGQIVVVLDLEKRFNLTRTNEKTPQEHIVIAEKDEGLFGVLVDHVIGVSTVPVSKIQETPDVVTSKIKADYIKGVAVLGEEERLLVILNIPILLQEKELLDVGKKVDSNVKLEDTNNTDKKHGQT